MCLSFVLFRGKRLILCNKGNILVMKFNSLKNGKKILISRVPDHPGCVRLEILLTFT